LERGRTVAVCTRGRPESVERFLESLIAQDRSAQLLLVDASHDESTELVVKSTLADLRKVMSEVEYIRVRGALVGTVRQRNLALRLTRSDLIAFFDDDVVLLPGCLAEMERVHRTALRVVGVGAFAENEHEPPSGLWRLRRVLRIVESLEPGRYTRSGISIPWHFREPGSWLVDGDWLPGCSMMWRTRDATVVKFNELLTGYANGEDLEFSLRMCARGRLLMSGSARVLHLQAAASRPSSYQMGYMGVRNIYHIHKTCLHDRRRRDGAYFFYAYFLDTFVRLFALVRPGNVRERWQFLRGRLGFFAQIALGKGEIDSQTE
jgi:GT2 family glycosyltransferase